MAVNDPKELAFNQYYTDLYSMKPGTQGQQMYNQLNQSYQRQANVGMQIADANYQAQALQQAQTVKAITDQVRAERMSRLRAGMSEAQIANQDMQMMMTNINALNDQAVVANQARLEAQSNAMLAQDQAYQDYLNQINTRSQSAAAMYAADAGNVQWATTQYMRQMYGDDSTKWTPQQWAAATEVINGTTQSEKAARASKG